MPTLIIAAGVVSVIGTLGVRRLAQHLKILDRPDGGRKQHGRSVALWCGLPLYLTFWGVLIYALPQGDADFLPLLPLLVALCTCSTIFLLIGLADDLITLSFKTRLPFLLAGLLSVAFAAPISKVTNPAGGFFLLPTWLGILLVLGWLLLTTFSIKILDGVDGLATSIGIVGSLIIAALTFSSKFYQPNVGFVALVFAAVLIGFLIFNAPPASIFLGESGSLFVGLMLGGLSIMAGSKIATALLVMALPVLDFGRVAVGRWRQKKSLFAGDRSHLHFVLLDRGWSPWAVLLFLTGIAALAGLIGLFLQSAQKLLALALVAVVFMILVIRLGLFKKK